MWQLRPLFLSTLLAWLLGELPAGDPGPSGPQNGAGGEEDDGGDVGPHIDPNG